MKHDLHGFVVDNGRDQHHPVDLPLPEHRALAGDSLLTGGGFPPTSLAQFPSSLPAPPRVSNLLPPPPRVGSQNAGIESRGRDGGGGSVLHDRAVASAQELRLMHNLVMGDGRLPPRQSQRSTRDHHTDRPSYGRGGRPPHRGFGRRPQFDKWRNRRYPYRDRSYPPRHHQRGTDESPRYDDELEGDDQWPSDAGSADQLPDDDSSLPAETELHSLTQPHAGDNEYADATVANSSAASNSETVPPS